MRFKFASDGLAEGFALGLSDPNGLDVYASVEGSVVEILGLDDHEFLASQIKESAQSIGGVLLP